MLNRCFLLWLVLVVSMVSFSASSAPDFNTAFERHGSVMLLIDPGTGRLVDANSAAAKFYGYSRASLRAMSIQDINMLTPQQVAEERELAKSENRNFFIFRHQLANGDIKTVEVTSSPIQYHGKTLLYSIIRDISPERELQEELWHYQSSLEDMVDRQVIDIQDKSRQLVMVLAAGIGILIIVILVLSYLLAKKRKAEEVNYKLSQIVEQSPVAVVRTDTLGNIDYVNKQFEYSSGYFAEEVLGKKPNILKSGKTSPEEYQQLWQTINQGNIWVGEFHNTRKNGDMYWERATIGPVRNIKNEITHFIALKEDISKLKQDEKQLRLASTVFKCATEAVMVTDADNKIQMVNNAFSIITGYNQDEVVGKDPSILASGHHDQAFYDEMKASIQQSGTWEGEIWNRRKDGEIYTEWLAITEIRDELGQLEGYVSLFSDITKRKENEVRIHFQANFDTLTGLANRNLFADRFSQALKRAEREKQKLALLFLDLDGFKHVNDTLGHSKGDALLKEVATRLVASLRKSDTVARLGGDEFAVLLPDCAGVEHIEHIATKIQDSVSAPYTLEGHDAFISVSIGITVYPDDGSDTETLLRKADSAMYKVKENGRKHFQFFTQEMDEKAQQRRTLEHDLRRALDNDELSVYFQPIIEASTGEVASAEALIRWNHPVKGVISPADFIPLAEDIGLIIPIGEWVLRQACQAAAAWQKMFARSPRIAVNISSHQFQRKSIFQLTKTILADTGLPADKLIMEITESLLISDDEETLAQLQAIRSLGIDLSIDDFGTGYSSLSYLKKFPITTLKIDRSFVMDVTTNPEDEALIKAIISMAHSLNLKVVAEGVETGEQASFLKSRNCQFIQGYLYSKPLVNEDFIDYYQDKMMRTG